MTSSSHDFVTVDMRGLKVALVSRAQAERVSVSAVVRRAAQRELGIVDASAEREPAAPPSASAVKLSIRLTRIEAGQLAAGARRASLSRGAFLAGLLVLWLVFYSLKVVISLFWVFVLAFIILYFINDRFRRAVAGRASCAHRCRRS